jgi:hypothetical protein
MSKEYTAIFFFLLCPCLQAANDGKLVFFFFFYGMASTHCIRFAPSHALSSFQNRILKSKERIPLAEEPSGLGRVPLLIQLVVVLWLPNKIFGKGMESDICRRKMWKRKSMKRAEGKLTG